MLQPPFVYLGAFLLATVLCPIFLPFAILVRYPALLVIGAGLVLRRFCGGLERPGQAASLWATYLGFILILHGVVICFDTPLAGAPPTAEQKRFGNGLAYAGAAVAVASAVAAYLLDPGRRILRTRVAKNGPPR